MRSKSRALTVCTLAVAGALVFIAARSAAVEAVYPVEKAKRTFTDKVMSRLRGMWKGANVGAENVRLRREVEALALVREDNERLEAENDRLREALGYAKARRGEWMAAVVLSAQSGASAMRNVLRVDKGSLDGVKLGAAVSVPDGLVGKVTDVGLHTSEIMLITDSRVKVACEVECGKKMCLRGIICGGSEEMLALRFPIAARDIPPRSRVMTSGLGGVFPRGIEIGTFITESEVMPSVNFSELEDVFIRREK